MGRRPAASGQNSSHGAKKAKPTSKAHEETVSPSSRSSTASAPPPKKMLGYKVQESKSPAASSSSSPVVTAPHTSKKSASMKVHEYKAPSSSSSHAASASAPSAPKKTSSSNVHENKGRTTSSSSPATTAPRPPKKQPGSKGHENKTRATTSSSSSSAATTPHLSKNLPASKLHMHGEKPRTTTASSSSSATPRSSKKSPRSKVPENNACAVSFSSSSSSSIAPRPSTKTRSQLGIEAIRRLKAGNAERLLPYKLKADSLVLFRPTQNEFNLETNPNGIVPVIVNPHFTSKPGRKLTQNQIDGIKFLWDSVVKRKEGCILAHGMGQGKTLTAIVLLFTLFEQREGTEGKMEPTIRKAIIVTPKSVLPVWEGQIAEWSPGEKKIQYKTISSGMKTSAAEEIIENFETDTTQVILLSYDSFKKYYNSFRNYKEPLDVAILDEAHYVKNPKARRSEVFGPHLLDDGSGHKPTVKTMIGLTGTPYQNDDEELCNLVNFFRPNCLSPQIQEQLLKDLKNADRTAKDPNKSQKTIDKAKEKVQEIRKQLHKIFKPVIQYRSSRVPGVDKHELVVCVKLADGAQQTMYEQVTSNPTFRKMNAFTKINFLRKICFHPEYACQDIDKKQFFLLDFVVPFKADIEEDKSAAPTIPNYAESGRLNFVVSLIAKILHGGDEKDQKNEKVVVVSYSTDQLDRVAEVCTAVGWDYAKFIGEHSETDRKKNLDKFQSNGEKVQILLLSSAAGGLGLNLAHANHLILMDPGWTPALDNQIVHRIYRKGQQKNCFVYRILATNTIEEVMFLNQLDKNEVDLYYQGQCPENEPQSAYVPKHLTVLHKSESGSFLKDTIDKINNGTSAEEDESIERQFFADELRQSKQYAKGEELPVELETLRNTWHAGVTFVFHKFWGNEGELLDGSDTEADTSSSNMSF